MNNLPELFAGIAPSKGEIEAQCQSIITEIKVGGSIDPLRVATIMKSLEIAMKMIKDGIAQDILDEAEKYEGKTFDFFGHSLSIRESGVKYNYTECNDPYMNDYVEEMNILKGKIKDRESFLKAVKDSATIVDDRTGDIVDIYPPSKSSTTSVTINLKK